MGKLTDEFFGIANFDYDSKEIHGAFKRLISELKKMELVKAQMGALLDDYFNFVGNGVYIISESSYDDCLETCEYYGIDIDEMFKRCLCEQPIYEKIQYFYKANITVDDDCLGLTHYPISELGMTWFFNREEAEKKLEELNNEDRKRTQ